MRKNKFSCFEGKLPAKPCPSGDRFKYRFELVEDHGNYDLKKVGRIDTQQQIESYRDSVSLQKMIERFNRGDDTALTRKNGFYADVTDFELNPAEVINKGRQLTKDLAAAMEKHKAADQSADQSAVNSSSTEAINE